MIPFVLALALQASPEPCLDRGERITGELRYVETQHPNGTPLRNAVLVLDEKRCVVDPDYGHAEGKWVQVSGPVEESVRDLSPSTTIVIEANEYLVPHTAWHVGDIVALDARLVGYELQ